MAYKSNFSWRKTGLLFLIAYPVCLILWLPVKDYYAAGLAYGGAQLTPIFQDVSFEGMEMKPDRTVVKFNFNLQGSRAQSVSVMINTSTYAFSMPLILALLLTLMPFLEKKWKPVIAIIIVATGTHFFHVILDQNYAINMALASDGFVTGGAVWVFCRRYLSEWMELLALRFLPFLCGFYLLMNTTFFKKRLYLLHPEEWT
jgi:hypothetical protein